MFVGKVVFVDWDSFDRRDWGDMYEELPKERDQYVVRGEFIKRKKKVEVLFKELDNYHFTPSQQWIKKYGTRTKPDGKTILTKQLLKLKTKEDDDDNGIKIENQMYPKPATTIETADYMETIDAIHSTGSKDEGIGIATWNINGQLDRIIPIIDALARLRAIDIIILTDTQHSSSSGEFATKQWTTLRPGGRVILSNSHGKLTGGIIMLITSKLAPFIGKRYNDHTGLGIYLEVAFRLPDLKLRVGGIYWPNYAGPLTETSTRLEHRLRRWIAEHRPGCSSDQVISDIVTSRIKKSKHYVIGGDFNTVYGEQRYTSITDQGLYNNQQHIHYATRFSGNLPTRQIDHIFANIPSLGHGFSDSAVFNQSDHIPIWARFQTNIIATENNTAERSSRKTINLNLPANIIKMRNAIAEQLPLCHELQEINDLIVKESTTITKHFTRKFWSPEFASDLIVSETLTRIARNPLQATKWIKSGSKRIRKLQPDGPKLLQKSLLNQDINNILDNVHQLQQQARRNLHHRQQKEKYTRFREACQRRQQTKYLFKELAATKTKIDLSILQTKEETHTDPIKIHRAVLEEFKTLFKAVKDFPEGNPLEQVKTIEGCEKFFKINNNQAHVLHAIIHSTTEKRVHTLRDLDHLQAGPSYQQFADEIHLSSKHSAPGASGLSYHMLQLQYPDTLLRIYTLMQDSWQRGDLFQPWLRKKLMCLIPKKAGTNSLNNIRPIVLCEVLRKVWIGAIVRQIRHSWEKNHILQGTQYGFRARRSCASCLIQLMNIFELQTPVFFSSWDLQQAFPSVARPIILLALQRLGVPLSIASILSSIDDDDLNIPITPSQSQEGFSSERGIGQGDKGSPTIWTAVMDILLTGAALQRSELNFSSLQGKLCTVRDTAYADDLLTFTSSHSGLQRKAILVETVVQALGLNIAFNKLRTGVINGRGTKPLVLQNSEGHYQLIEYMQPTEEFKYLGINCTSTQPYAKDLLSTLHKVTQHLTTKLATSKGYAMYIAGALIPQVAYSGTFNMNSLQQCRLWDAAITTFYKNKLHLPTSFPTELLYAHQATGGLGLPRLSDEVQKHKLRIIQRALEGTLAEREAMEAILLRHSTREPTCYTISRATGWLQSLVEILHENDIRLRIGAKYKQDLFGKTINTSDGLLQISGWNEQGVLGQLFVQKNDFRRKRAAHPQQYRPVGLTHYSWNELEMEAPEQNSPPISIKAEHLYTDGSWESPTRSGAAIIAGHRHLFLHGIDHSPQRAFSQEVLALVTAVCLCQHETATIHTDCLSAIKGLHHPSKLQTTGHQLLRLARRIRHRPNIEWIKAHQESADQHARGNCAADAVAGRHASAEDISHLVNHLLDSAHSLYMSTDNYPANYHGQLFRMNTGLRYYQDRGPRVRQRGGAPCPSAETVSTAMRWGTTIGQKAAILRLTLGKFEDDRAAFEGNLPTCSCGCRGFLDDWLTTCHNPHTVKIRQALFQDLQRTLRDQCTPHIAIPLQVFRGNLENFLQHQPQMANVIGKACVELSLSIRSLCRQGKDINNTTKDEEPATATAPLPRLSQTMITEWISGSNNETNDSRSRSLIRAAERKEATTFAGIRIYDG